MVELIMKHMNYLPFTLVPPEVLPSPRSGLVHVRAGESVSMSCDITAGYPEPTLSWVHKVMIW